MTQGQVPAGPDELLSAEVVLHGWSGSSPAAIRGADLAARSPDPAQATDVRQWFADRGFATSEVYGISFSVTGPRSLFENIGLPPGSRPGVDVVELPPLPGPIAAVVECVTFSPPPDFGPTSY